jgi:3-deoxy-7-phosphoheptulonate synthase
MIVEMKTKTPQAEIDVVVGKAKSLGFEVQLNTGTDKTVVAILGSTTGKTPVDIFAILPGVESVTRIMKPYKLASREFKPENTCIKIQDVEIGGNRQVVVAGPCAVESQEQLLQTAHGVKKAGASVLRGGAFKPRTSPFSFQGLKESGLKLLKATSEQVGMPIVTEIVDTHDVDLFAEYVDIIQIGSRNMQNYSLLTAVGKTKKPVVLKRGFSCTVTEW